MDKKQKQDEIITNDALLANALLRLTTLENLLLEKGIFTKEEFNKATAVATANIVKVILQRANIPGDLDSIIKSLSEKN